MFWSRYQFLFYLQQIMPRVKLYQVEHIMTRIDVLFVAFESILLLTLSRRRTIAYRNQSINLLCKSMDWFLYDIGLRRERVKWISLIVALKHLNAFIGCHILTPFNYWYTREKLLISSLACKIQQSYMITLKIASILVVQQAGKPLF